MAALLLAACGNESGIEPEKEASQAESDSVIEDEEVGQLEDEEIDSPDEEEKIEIEDPNGNITDDWVKEVLEIRGMGEQDKLVSATFQNGEIKAAIEMESRALMEDDFLAVLAYTKASEELLSYEGWDVLTIEYINIGTISLNRSEKEVNEDGKDHFPVEKMAGNLR